MYECQHNKFHQNDTRLPTVGITLRRYNVTTGTTGMDFRRAGTTVRILSGTNGGNDRKNITLHGALTVLKRNHFLPGRARRRLRTTNVSMLGLTSADLGLGSHLRLLGPILGSTTLFSGLFNVRGTGTTHTLMRNDSRLNHLALTVANASSTRRRTTVMVSDCSRERTHVGRRVRSVGVDTSRTADSVAL